MSSDRQALVPTMLGVSLTWCVAACGDDGAVAGSGTTQVATTGTSALDDSETGLDVTTAVTSSTGGSAEGTGQAESSTGVVGLGPPYPIVLAHGFFGFDDFAGVDFVNYYWGVVDHLAEQGEPLVFTPAVDPFNDSTVRGQQLLEHVEVILAETGHAKVNIIGHSQGGLDARVVANLRPDLVASVTTVATPHGGSPIADIVLGLVDDPNAQALVDAIVQIIGAPLWDEIGQETSVTKALHQFSEPGIEAFNEMYPDAPGVLYMSVTGRTDLHLGGEACETDDAPPFISEFDNERDPVDPLFSLSEGILDGSVVNPAPNDGLVLVEDAKWGIFLGCVPADHTDEVGHLLGDSPGVFNDWDHYAFYADLVALLRAEGL